MKPIAPRLEPPDVSDFTEKFNQVPAEYLWQFADEHVAWCPRTMKIVAHANSTEALYCELEKLGIDTSQVVLDYINDPDLSQL